MTDHLPYYSVVMAGGGGTRFWPMSRQKRPKQLLPLAGPESMIRQTVDRLLPVFGSGKMLIVTNEDHADAIRRDLPMLDVEDTVPEPMGRDTAAALGLAAVILQHRAGGPALFCAVPADHVISEVKRFHASLRQALDLAQGGRPITFGIKPHVPATGYGYIQRGTRLAPGVFEIKRFCEKPNLALAKRFLRTRRYYWNSGMFVFRTDALLTAMEKYLPATHLGLMRIQVFLGTDEQEKVIREEYEKLSRISIDYGVMERWKGGIVLEATFGWNDVGTWGAVAQLKGKKGKEDVAEGPVAVADGCGNVVLTSADHAVGIVGLSDVIVVHTPDATLVCDRKRAEDVKKLVDRMKRTPGLEKFL